jgi:hypothetical protein
MTRRVLGLDDAERVALRRLRDQEPKAYLRERAAALLKVADGVPAAVVARERLLKPRDPDAVYAWLDRYQAEGVGGLRIRPGRGRKPAFSPPLPGSPGRQGRAAGHRPA